MKWNIHTANTRNKFRPKWAFRYGHLGIGSANKSRPGKNEPETARLSVRHLAIRHRRQTKLEQLLIWRRHTHTGALFWLTMWWWRRKLSHFAIRNPNLIPFVRHYFRSVDFPEGCLHSANKVKVRILTKCAQTVNLTSAKGRLVFSRLLFIKEWWKKCENTFEKIIHFIQGGTRMWNMPIWHFNSPDKQGFIPHFW
jgi:hypothetical protein